MKSRIKLSVIIPTKDRPLDLQTAVESLVVQTSLPDELVVVDQSGDGRSKVIVEASLAKEPRIKLIYLHDPSIGGLVEAKKIGVSQSSGDVICFLEDDIELEKDYLEQTAKAFHDNSNMVGSCGVVTNPPYQSLIYNVFFNFFHLGIFRDIRVNAFCKVDSLGTCLIPSDKLSGGISAWRRVVFDRVKFDIKNGFHMFEDIDFSTRVCEAFPGSLYINLNAKLAHYSSNVNRHLSGERQKRKIREAFVYYKKRRNWNNATLSFSWLLVGMFFEAIYQSFSEKSWSSFKGYWFGFWEGLLSEVYLDA